MAEISEKRRAIIQSVQDMALGMIEPTESVSQQITRLLGTDDWAILHSGHQLVTAEDLDDMEGRVA